MRAPAFSRELANAGAARTRIAETPFSARRNRRGVVFVRGASLLCHSRKNRDSSAAPSSRTIPRRCGEFFRSFADFPWIRFSRDGRIVLQGRTGRKAIVLLIRMGQGQRPGPSHAGTRAALPGDRGAAAARLVFDDVARELGADGIALFIVSTENRPRQMTQEWLEAHSSKMLVTAEARKQNMPNYTLYLAELARRAGGLLYFLRETGNLSEFIHRRIAGDRRAAHARLLSLGGNRAPRLALAARRASDWSKCSARLKADVSRFVLCFCAPVKLRPRSENSSL